MNENEIAVAHKVPACPPESDENLLIFIGMKDECPDEASASWGELFCRHREYVFNLAKKIFPRLDEDSHEDLVLETFSRVWRKASKFSSGGLTDPVRISRRFRVWLGYQLRHAYVQLFNARENTFEDEFWSMQKAKESDCSSDNTKNGEIQKALETLTDRERIVIQTTVQYFDPDHPKKHIPDSVLQALANELNTTTDNIRQIRHRASKKLNNLLGAVIKKA